MYTPYKVGDCVARNENLLKYGAAVLPPCLSQGGVCFNHIAVVFRHLDQYHHTLRCKHHVIAGLGKAAAFALSWVQDIGVGIGILSQRQSAALAAHALLDAVARYPPFREEA